MLTFHEEWHILLLAHVHKNYNVDQNKKLAWSSYMYTWLEVVHVVSVQSVLPGSDLCIIYFRDNSYSTWT